MKINLSQEYGSIGEKVAIERLKQDGYEVYRFQDIMWHLDSFRHVKKVESKLTSEKARENLQRLEKFIEGFFGERLEDIEAFVKAIRKLAKEELETRLARHYSRLGIAPDFIVKKNNDLFFVEVKVNQSEPKKYQRASFQIAQNLGFKTIIVRLNVQIRYSGIQLTEP